MATAEALKTTLIRNNDYLLLVNEKLKRNTFGYNQWLCDNYFTTRSEVVDHVLKYQNFGGRKLW